MDRWVDRGCSIVPSCRPIWTKPASSLQTRSLRRSPFQRKTPANPPRTLRPSAHLFPPPPPHPASSCVLFVGLLAAPRTHLPLHPPLILEPLLSSGQLQELLFSAFQPVLQTGWSKVPPLLNSPRFPLLSESPTFLPWLSTHQLPFLALSFYKLSHTRLHHLPDILCSSILL